ncbi:MAG: hypothetical protein KC996_02370 [Phycisphaerales bacterium]|nr:hypothetical protein [Phycisphaerales bacterium]
MNHTIPALAVSACATTLAFGAAVNHPEAAQSLNANDLRTGGPTLYTCIELQGLESWDGSGDLSNIVIEQFLGIGTEIVGARWEDVQLSTTGNSFLNEASIGLNNQVALRVAAADNFSGTGTYTSPGVFDFIANEISYTLDDGMLSLEFFETQDDASDTIDARYGGGKLYIYYIPVPAPGSVALLGLAGVAVTRRGRS